MEHLIDGQFVWLRSRMADVYLHANEDGLSVSVRANRASRNAAWRVQHRLCEEGNLLLLQGAAYGRYLAATGAPAPPGHHGFRAQQRDFDELEAPSSRWHALVSKDGEAILILHASPLGLRFLRANGEPHRWQSGVTIDAMDNLSLMMHWVVLPIPPRDTTPPLPGPRQISGYKSVLLGRNVEEDQSRVLHCVCAGPDGSVNAWDPFQFPGRSVFNLRNHLAQRLGEGVVFTMYVRAGYYARLTPLVVDLPVSSEPLVIVIIMDGSPVIQDLTHPDVDAP